MLTHKNKQAIPYFQVEGYAIYENMGEIKLPDGTVFPTASGKIIGIKSDAPQWAKDEYELWKATQEEAKRTNTKL